MEQSDSQETPRQKLLRLHADRLGNKASRMGLNQNFNLVEYFKAQRARSYFRLLSTGNVIPRV